MVYQVLASQKAFPLVVDSGTHLLTVHRLSSDSKFPMHQFVEDRVSGVPIKNARWSDTSLQGSKL